MKSAVKCLVLGMLTAAATATSFAQGIVYFGNNDTALIRLPSGAGVPVGSTFGVELMFAPDGTSADSFDTLAIRLGASIGFSPRPGEFNGGTRTAPLAQPGGFGLFQVRAWEAAYGSSYAEAASAPPMNGQYALVGKSQILRVDTGDPTQIPRDEPAVLMVAGFQGFTVTPVPEPSTIALAFTLVIALPAWRILRR